VNLPPLILLFVGSGCAALIYEVVWLQLLQLVVGSTAASLGTLLGTFMGGMCLGSYMLPRLVSAGRHPLRVYAAIEFAIGLCGLAALAGLPLVARVYVAAAGYGMAGILLRSLVAGVCLLPPTILMGASLPAIARWIRTTPEGVAWMGFFYGGNIAGAVFGCLLAGFYLLRVFDMTTATLVAVAINLLVAAAAWMLARGIAGAPAETPPGETPPRGPRVVYVAIALSGACALGAEVVWTRVLSLMLGGTVYTFSIILAVFLAGLGLGSGFGSMLARRLANPRGALAWCQILLTAAIAWTALMLTRSLPYWPINPTLTSNPWLTFQLDLVRCLWAMLPPAFLWGASFPLAMAAAARPGQDPGRLAGGVYAANTLGAIVGAIAFSMGLIPWIGTQNAQRALIGMAAVAAAILMTARRSRAVVQAALSLSLAALLAGTIAPVPWELIAFGRRLPMTAGWGEVLYVGEGRNASIAVSEWDDGKRMFHVAGKVEASGEPHDMRVQRMLGHVPALMHPNPKSALVVGFGAGVTAGSLALHPSIERIVICEIEPLIPQVVSRFFRRENYNVIRDKRVEVIYDDARHYMLTGREVFDVITSDPVHPWVKGAATLYSKEYFEMCRRRLKPGGTMVQWVPLYESDAGAVKSEMATFFSVFRDGTIWANELDGEGYDVVLLGRDRGGKIDVDALARRLARPDHASVARSLTEVFLGSAPALLETYAGRARDLGPWLLGAAITSDRNLRLQYLAGMGLNANRGAAIYREILGYRRYPEDLFAASESYREALEQALRPRQ
jgi:spermidine synthase